jgi:hypothetical protein
MRTLPSVVATYYREGSYYEVAWAGGKMTLAERRWWAQHHNEPGARPKQEATLVDLLPTTLDLMSVPRDPAHPLDGTVLPVHQREGG